MTTQSNIDQHIAQGREVAWGLKHFIVDYPDLKEEWNRTYNNVITDGDPGNPTAEPPVPSTPSSYVGQNTGLTKQNHADFYNAGDAILAAINTIDSVTLAAYMAYLDTFERKTG